MMLIFFGKTEGFNEDADEGLNKKGSVVEIGTILFIMIPAGVLYLYLLVRTLRQCLLGCFY